MPQYGTWVSYGGTARIVLAIVMVAAAGGVAYTGTLLLSRFGQQDPVRQRGPSCW